MTHPEHGSRLEPDGRKLRQLFIPGEMDRSSLVFPSPVPGLNGQLAVGVSLPIPGQWEGQGTVYAVFRGKPVDGRAPLVAAKVRVNAQGRVEHSDTSYPPPIAVGRASVLADPQGPDRDVFHDRTGIIEAIPHALGFLATAGRNVDPLTGEDGPPREYLQNVLGMNIIEGLGAPEINKAMIELGVQPRVRLVRRQLSPDAGSLLAEVKPNL